MRADDLANAARIGAALAALAGLIAIAVHVAVAADARQALGFSFAGLPRELGEAADIFVNNLRVLLAVLAACGVAQVAQRGAAAGAERALMRVVTALCDVAVVVGCAVNVLLVGAAVGAYGGRILGSIALHGPFEIGALSLGLALYVAARHERVTATRFAATAAAAIVGLGVAAPLEVYA